VKLHNDARALEYKIDMTNGLFQNNPKTEKKKKVWHINRCLLTMKSNDPGSAILLFWGGRGEEPLRAESMPSALSA
jgi:hypothetical protein